MCDDDEDDDDDLMIDDDRDDDHLMLYVYTYTSTQVLLQHIEEHTSRAHIQSIPSIMVIKLSGFQTLDLIVAIIYILVPIAIAIYGMKQR